MKRLIKRLLFSFILLITCPFFTITASPQPNTGAETLISGALSDLHAQRLKRAENNIRLESALQEMTSGKNARQINNKPHQSPGQTVLVTAPARPAAIQKNVANPAKGAESIKGAPSGAAVIPGSIAAAAVPAPSRQSQDNGKKVIYGSGKDAKSPDETGMFQVNDNLFMSAGESDKQFDPLAPRKDTFPGDKHTLSQMDKSTPLEATVLYRLDKKNSARLQINNDDENSPIYTPRPYDREMTSAGIFMDMEVKKDLQLELGGQHRSMESETGRLPNGFTDTGASLGLKYLF